MMQKSGDRRLTNRHVLRRQYGLELSQRDIRLLCHQLPDQVLVRRQSIPLVSAEFGRNDTARFAVEPTKADHRADTHTEALRNFRYRGALLRRPHHARTQILRIRLPHPILASFPARILNPIRVRMGIPPDSVFSGNALGAPARTTKPVCTSASTALLSVRTNPFLPSSSADPPSKITTSALSPRAKRVGIASGESPVDGPRVVTNR